MKFVIDNKKKSTRNVILHALKSSPNLTVDQLGETAGISPVTVRHHLNSLQADGLLVATKVRRKVGRPHFVYSLSETGYELFPKKYARLSSRLIQELKDQFSPEVVTQLFANVVQRIVEEQQTSFEDLPFEGKLDFVVKLLSEEGFLAKWEKQQDGTYHIVESSCPYMSVGQTHDEVCSFDHGLIVAVLDTPVIQNSCMLEGDNCCQFSIVPPVTMVESH